jgi:hypothetical protein
MSPLVLTALLAFGLAVLLARENRLRRAFQDLVTRLLEKLRETGTPGSDFPPHRRRR